MSTKASTQPSRRTPLSLSGATSKQQQQQQQQQQQSTNSRNDKPTTSNQKTEQTATTTSTQKDNKNKQQQQPVDKKTQQQITKVASSNTTSSGSVKKPERNEEKKTQNGVGNGNSNNGNVKEKHQNGKEASANENLKDKKENKMEKVEKNEKPAAVNIDKKEKLEKEKEKKREQEKEKEKEAAEIEKVKATEKEEAELAKKEKEVSLKKEKEVSTKKEKADLAQKEKEETLQIEQEKLLEKEKERSKDVENKPEKETRSKRNIVVESTEKKHQHDDDVEQMDISANDEKPATPATPTRRSAIEHKFDTPKKHDGEKQSSQETPIKTTLRSATPSSNQSSTSLTYTTNVRSVTTTTSIDDVEMEPLLVEEGSPKRPQSVEEQTSLIAAAPAPTEPKPAATSTPGKFLTFKEIFFSESPKKVQQIASSKFPDRNSCPRSFSQISGRRSIRPGNDAYTYSYFQNYAQYRESYRRINTELDGTSNTNTSLNVTVGSEVPNNSSFSFFGRGCKRDRTPPNVVTQSTVDLDLEISPKSPKRARIDMHGFFSAVASPLTLLRSRFSKTSIQSSTPVKLRLSSKLSAAESAEDEEVEVQNVSGISIEEEIEPAAVADADDTATEDITVGNEGDEKKELSTSSSSAKHESAVKVESMATDANADVVPQEPKLEKFNAEHAIEADCKHNKNSIEETVNTEGLLVGGGDAVVKNKKCSIM